MAGPPPPGSRAIRVWNAVTKVNTAIYRRTGGKRLGTWMGRMPLLLLDHVGRRSGELRTAPLAYLRDGEDYVIAASRGGSDSHPAWYHNLMAQPDTTIQVGSEKVAVTAHEADPAERARLWPLMTAANKGFEGYERATSREIPVIVLRPRG